MLNLKTLRLSANDDTYEAVYNLDTFSFQEVWRYPGMNNSRPRLVLFADLPVNVQQRFENLAIGSINKV